MPETTTQAVPSLSRGRTCPYVRETGRPSVRLSVCLSVRPFVPVRTLTPKVFNFHVSYLVHRYRLWRWCVTTYVRHLMWLPWQPGRCFPCSSTILDIPSCSGVYCAHLSSCYYYYYYCLREFSSDEVMEMLWKKS